MLTADLVRAQVKKGLVRPRWLDTSDPALVADAANLVSLFARFEGERVGALEEAVADLIGDSTDFFITRGLAKLLLDTASFEVRAAHPPEALRAAVFAAAGAAGTWPVRAGGGDGFTAREEVLARVGAALGLSPAEVEEGLFADLDAERRLVSFDRLDGRALLERYNLGVAQAIVLRATEVRVELPGVSPQRLRQLLRALKFRGLMHRAERTTRGYRLVLDGPASLFRQTGRYGLQLALFLPALALAERWYLDADVTWGPKRAPCRFELDHGQGLVTRARDTGTWVSEEERHLEASFAALDTPWRLERGVRLVDLDGRDVLAADYALVHPDGREAWLDIVWFWRKDAFARRLALLRAHGPEHLIVAVATRLNADRADPAALDLGAVTAYPFKGVLVPKRLIALAEPIARVPPPVVAGELDDGDDVDDGGGPASV